MAPTTSIRRTSRYACAAAVTLVLLHLAGTATSEQPSGASSTYVVRRGDSLSEISARCYGSSVVAEDLCSVNHDLLRIQLGPNPTTHFCGPDAPVDKPVCACIAPGWQILLPAKIDIYFRSSKCVAPSPTQPPTPGAADAGAPDAATGSDAGTSSDAGPSAVAAPTTPGSDPVSVTTKASKPSEQLATLATTLREAHAAWFHATPDDRRAVAELPLQASQVRGAPDTGLRGVPPGADKDARSAMTFCVERIGQKYRVDQDAAIAIARRLLDAIESKVEKPKLPFILSNVCGHLPDALPFYSIRTSQRVGQPKPRVQMVPYR